MQYEEVEYSPATVRQRTEAALHTLMGILEGIECDKKLNEGEVRYLDHWMFENDKIAQNSHVKKLYKYIQNATTGKTISLAEMEEVHRRISMITEDEYYDVVTAKLQELHGIVGGIAADRLIEKREIEYLTEWLETNRTRLKSHYPYDEIESLVFGLFHDGNIAKEDHDELVEYFQQFVALSGKKTLDVRRKYGIVSIDPELFFFNRRFSITGASHKAKRSEMVQVIEERNGTHNGTVCLKTDYLVYCDGGSKAWAYSCYGRKIEEAMRLRETGHTIQIIAERDFWDACIK